MPVENFHGNEIELLNQYLLHTLVQLATKSLKHTTTEPQVALLVPKVVGIFTRCLVSWVHYFYDHSALPLYAVSAPRINLKFITVTSF